METAVSGGSLAHTLIDTKVESPSHRHIVFFALANEERLRIVARPDAANQSAVACIFYRILMDQVSPISREPGWTKSSRGSRFPHVRIVGRICNLAVGRKLQFRAATHVDVRV